MIPFWPVADQLKILCIAGPTASGKSSRAVSEALARNGEIISVDSRQIYTTLDIGTEKITPNEMQGVPHHLIDIRDPKNPYSAGDFVKDAERLITEITARGNLPILVGGSHFYFDALLYGLPEGTDKNDALRAELEQVSGADLFARLSAVDPNRAKVLDPRNRRRLIRALEIAAVHGVVPERAPKAREDYAIEWIVINPPSEELRKRIGIRLEKALSQGLVDEVRRVREYVGDTRLNELGLEYKVIGEYLRGERMEASLLPTLSSRLWHYARRQKAWVRKLHSAR